jgi:ATP-binding protein involved in chromosome partitioning
VATVDSRKAVKFVEMLGFRVLGIIENMSGMICPHCKQEIDLFGKGGGEKAAQDMGVPFLGSIPIDPEMRKAGDEGRPYVIRRGEANPTWEAVDRVMEALVQEVEK